MQFNSIDFLFFFPIVLGIYFIVPKKCRKIWLLSASYYFYMSWNPKYILLIAVSTIVTYISGILMEKSNSLVIERRWKKGVLISCFLINIGILIIFKYADFTVESLNSILRMLHISMVQRKLDIVLPVGISFYTFQALGYIMDVYRGEVVAEKNLATYALFVSFFPQLVAGPIERSPNLLPQMRSIEENKIWNAERVSSGAILMVWGLFMKMVIADRIAILVDTVFNNYRMYGSVELIIAAVGFAIQIYCDFGSYSTIAIGAAKIMGVDLMENFNSPYMARNIRDFWGRWHISLSTWFRDYLYIPLGGNRKGKVRKAINLMVVFLVSGLWHGASWNFVVWGGIHGAMQVAEDFLVPYKNRIIKCYKVKTKCLSWRLLQIARTFFVIDFAWIFFRSDTVFDALRFIKRIFIRPTPWVLFNGGIYLLGLDRVEMNILSVSLLFLLLVDFVRYRLGKTIDKFLMEQNLWFEWLTVICLILMVFVFGEYGPVFDAQQFIYFQF